VALCYSLRCLCNPPSRRVRHRRNVVLRPRSQALEHLAELLPEIEQVLSTLAPGQFVEVAGPH